MATLTLPMRAPCFSDRDGPVTVDRRRGPGRLGGSTGGSGGSGGGARRGRRVRRGLRGPSGRTVGPGSGGAAALVVDQLGQPADLAVDRVKPVALQFEGVAVDALAGAGQRRAQALPLALDGAAAPL